MGHGLGRTTDGTRAGRPPVLHPFLLAAFPVVFLWARNVRYDVAPAPVLAALGATLAATGLVLWGAWRLLGRDLSRAGVATSIGVAAFFGYGHLYRALQGASPGASAVHHRFLLPAWGLAAGAAVAAVARSHRAPAGLTRSLNSVATLLVAVNLVMGGWGAARGGPALSAPSPEPGPRGPASEGRTPPDIYYLIFDRYAGERALREIFHHDNRPFLDSLRARGFYVADRSTANYPRTSHSLASSLNYDYLDRLLAPGRPSGSYAPVYDLIRGGRAPRFLKARGYRYVHIGSWWGPTADSPQADVNVKMTGALGEFATTLLQTTAFQPVAALLWDSFEPRKREYLRVRFELDRLARTAGIPGPKFVFAHILLPHEPFIFDRHGRFVARDPRGAPARRRAYVEQLLFANREILKLVDRLLAGPPDRRPAVVLQADEGAFETFAVGAEAGPRTLERKFGILNAYYLPRLDPEEAGLHPSITPVNTFRVLFNAYFGAGLPLLPDRNYVWAGPDDLYTFTDVTGKVGSG
jgi:hypothetical protein